MQAPADWYKTFFSGLAVEVWLSAMPADETEREVAFLRAHLRVAPPARLLDIPCGGGRHSIALAAAGFAMTGVDISPAFLHAARTNGPALDWHERDMTELPWTSHFDGAFCFGNSFGYLADADNARFVHAVATALKPGARFVIDYGAVMEALLSTWRETSSYQFGDIHFERTGRYDPYTGRIHVEYTLRRGDQVERRQMSQRVYTCHEVCELLQSAGFADLQAFGGLNGEPFALASNRLLLTATKK